MSVQRDFEDVGEILRIAKSLPEFFTTSALERIETESARRNLVYLHSGSPVGFLTYDVTGTDAEIKWLAVEKVHWGKGFGTELMETFENMLLPQGIERIIVRTLDESAGYGPYTRTNAFYRKMGFVKKEVIDPYPEWGPENPCAVYERSIIEDKFTVQEVLTRYCSRLVPLLLKDIDPKSVRNVVEFGPGTGNFTVPLLEWFGKGIERIVLVDPYKGPYKGHGYLLAGRLRKVLPEDKFEVVPSPIDLALLNVKDIDLIIGHDVLCDMDEAGIERTFRAAFNALSEHGIFIHSGLSNEVNSPEEELLRTLDGYTCEEGHWFAPTDEVLVELARRVGIEGLSIEHHKVPLKLKGRTAIGVLDSWRVPPEVVEIHKSNIFEIGLELPPEQVVKFRVNRR